MRDKKLAIECNLCIPEPRNPYKWVMENVKTFLVNDLKINNERVIEFLSTNLKVHKYSLMCYAYNQTGYGRLEFLKEKWTQEYVTVPNYEEHNCLSMFAMKYPDFVSTLIPNLNKKLDLLNEAAKLVVKETKYLSLKTLDGEKLSWTFFKSTVRRKRQLNPVTNELYNISINETDLKDGKPTISLRHHETCFLPYLIHSLDAAVLRHFIREIYKKEKLMQSSPPIYGNK